MIVIKTQKDPETLKRVCQGMVYLVENHTNIIGQSMEVVLRFMLKASQHAEYQVRLEALEVWSHCAHVPAAYNLLRAMLPDLVPVLLNNMVYCC